MSEHHIIESGSAGHGADYDTDHWQTCNMDERTNEEKLRDTITAQAQEIDGLKAMVNGLRDAIFHAACDLAESDIAGDDGLVTTHNDLIKANQQTEAQSLSDRDMRVGEKVKAICANYTSREFFDGYEGALIKYIRNLDLKGLLTEPSGEESGDE